jgi:hypothetical protein
MEIVLTAAAGYTHFSGVFSTVFPLVILVALLIWYVLAEIFKSEGP